ncbi:hypothetical protein J53TS2_36170 [Paenibacillus sp. J53TS2]|uniref:restriction endonuclease subunit S n=1 Tax=Paenibacillus sp. J53TS2 TaxID=2807197 RepID=UPI001B1FC59E|nr:restriction endonuclease subunit S [Paenibacillus sp. J53TS2]GIP50026.1 hypothetical protein J53TS2_36170 [Paenibacillus sp. J53TS2]
MNSDWGRFKVSELIADKILVIGDGYRAKNSELSVSGIPFARAGNINNGFQFKAADYFPIDQLEKVGEKISRPGDVVFTSKGTVGRFAFVKQGTQKFVYSPQLCFWRSLNSEKLHPRFLYYWMQSRDFEAQVNAVKGQTDMADYVSLKDQRRMNITIPEIEEQVRISKVLSCIDDKIELNNAINKNLEEMAKALFKRWFVDFEFPNDNGEPYKSSGGEFEDSELGLIPKGWEVKELSELIEINKGLSYKSMYLTEKDDPEGFPMVSLSNFNFGAGFKHDKTKFYKGPYKESHCVSHGDIVIAATDVTQDRKMLGSPAIVPNILNRMIFSLDVFKVKTTSEKLFYYYHLQTNDYRGRVEGSATGTTVTRISSDVILKHKIAYPPIHIREEFENIASTINKKVEELESEKQKLQNLRDLLIPKLMSGEIRIPVE